MRKSYVLTAVGGILAGFLVVLPLLAVSGVSQTPIAPFSGAGATGVTASAAVDMSHMQNAAVQIWCNAACGAGTTINVEIRSTSTAPWYTAAQCVNPPASGAVTTQCYFTLPLAKDFRIDMTVYGGSGNAFALYNERIP